MTPRASRVPLALPAACHPLWTLYCALALAARCRLPDSRLAAVAEQGHQLRDAMNSERK
jgi:hypothetical protein